ncbi:MucBP domain-containing protein [Levilactobacillus brevis]|uniref:MucBP domain-containing protein n=1 Tax=Levilactobacillus brevis TaxID=1580 RepID=UPI001BADC6CE|nr:MucBP domain-containing protein [Levilactobacillus brevis]MBS1005936.1 MucBP domain-containing protein [Levilactobacillus brevis]
MENKKIHYKMYKSGKFIMYSAIFSLTMGLGLGITTSAEASTVSIQPTAASSVTDSAQSTAASSVADSAQSTAASSVADSAQSTATSSVVDGAQSTSTSNVNIKSPATTTVTPSSNNYVTPTKEQLDQLKAQIEKSTDNFNTSFGSQLPTGVKIDELKVDNNTHKIIISASTSAPNINSKDNMYTTYAIAAQIMMAPDITKTVFDMSLNKFQVEMVITNTNMQNQQISMTINGSYTMAVTVSGKTVDGQSLYSQVDTKNMYAGDSWSSTPAEIDGYHVVTSLLPENASGTANILATQEIIYVYAPDTTPGDNGGTTPGDNEQLARLWYNTPYSVEKNTQTYSSKKDTTQLPQTDDNKKNSENLTTIGALLVFVVGVIHFTLKKRVI